MAASLYGGLARGLGRRRTVLANCFGCGGLPEGEEVECEALASELEKNKEVDVVDGEGVARFLKLVRSLVKKSQGRPSLLSSRNQGRRGGISKEGELTVLVSRRVGRGNVALDEVLPDVFFDSGHGGLEMKILSAREGAVIGKPRTHKGKDRRFEPAFRTDKKSSGGGTPAHLSVASPHPS